MRLREVFGIASKEAPILYLPLFLALAHEAINWVAALQLPPPTRYPLTILNAIVCSAAPSLATYDVCIHRNNHTSTTPSLTTWYKKNRHPIKSSGQS